MNKFNKISSICIVCGITDDKMYKCIKCKERFYCSSDCQRKDWPNHKNYCVLHDKKPRYYKIIDAIFQTSSFSVFVNSLAFLLPEKMLGACKVNEDNGIFYFNVKTLLISEADFCEDKEAIYSHLNKFKDDKIMLFDFTLVTECENSNLSVGTLDIKNCKRDYDVISKCDNYPGFKFPINFGLDVKNNKIYSGDFTFTAKFTDIKNPDYPPKGE